MKQRVNSILRTGGMLALAVAIIVGLAKIPTDTWVWLGRETAAITVGLEHPRESLQYIGTLAADNADNTDETAPTVPVEDSVPLEDPEESVIPSRKDGGGTVSEQTLGGTSFVGKVAIKNNSGVAYDFAALLKAGAPEGETVTDAPQVLIVHTHGCECYMSYYAGYYNPDDPVRSTDGNESVVAVGQAIAEELRAEGIGVVHDTTLHDAPEYNGAYSRAEQTITSYLEAYPSIRVVLDIHRDAMEKTDGTKIKPTVTVEGRKAAQIMAVVGGTSTPERENAYCEENLRWALSFHHAMETQYEGIMRPLYVVDARYNQGLLAGSMLLEIGTDANTLSEAIYSGRLVGRQLSVMLTTS